MAYFISDTRWAPKGGVIYDFLLKSAAALAELPQPGEWAAPCSTALDIETYDVYFLLDGGWAKGGEGR